MNKRVSIVSVKMVKEKSVTYNFRAVSTPKDLYCISRGFLEDSDREKMLLICFNTKNEPTHIEILSVGTLNTSLVHPREVFKTVVLSNAASFAVAHNHPSGNCNPSGDDVDITKRLKEAAKIMGVELLDHIIIGEGNYVSLREKGVLSSN